MLTTGLAEGKVFDLDFHAIMHWGEDPVMERHYVPRRSQRTRSVLTFFAQDSGTHNLVYAGADLAKATQHREVIAFCDHWKQVSGADPAMLVLDQEVTTHKVLGELDQRGVKFLTLRMRSPSLVRHIDNLPPPPTPRSPWIATPSTANPRSARNSRSSSPATRAPSASSSSPASATTPQP